MGFFGGIREWLRQAWIGASVIGEVLMALAARGKFWLIPSVLVIVLLGLLFVVVQSTPLSVIIYGLI